MANNQTTITFTISLALGTPVVGIERGTLVSVFNFNSSPRIMDATHEVDPAVTVSHDFGIQRGSVISIISKTPNMLRASRPAVGLSQGFPSRKITPGQFQFVLIQRAGTLEVNNVNIQTDIPVF